MTISEVLMAWGIPAAFFSALFGLITFFFKRHLDKRDKRIETREKRVEQFMLYILKDTRANNVLAVATARAVQRIPDAHCNGDMHDALAKAAAIQNEEKDFIFDQGIDHIFGSH